MKGRYDDLSQESWDSACDNMPQDYLDTIVSQTMPRKRRLPTTDAELKANGEELHAIEGRLMGREMPRHGQPSFDAPLVEWYREYLFRRKHPLWYEREYHCTDDYTLIHRPTA